MVENTQMEQQINSGYLQNDTETKTIKKMRVYICTGIRACMCNETTNMHVNMSVKVIYDSVKITLLLGILFAVAELC